VSEMCVIVLSEGFEGERCEVLSHLRGERGKSRR